MKNYAAIHYIQEQLRDFNPKFVNCVVRCFNYMDNNRIPDGCLSNTVVLYVCAKEYGYRPELCYGLCSLFGIQFYHAWLEMDGTVIDLAIYGNVNFSPFSLWDFVLDTPYIGSYVDSVVEYGKFVFDEDWKISQISKMEGMSLEQYVNNAPENCVWKQIFSTMDKTPTRNLKEHLTSFIRGKTI